MRIASVLVSSPQFQEEKRSRVSTDGTVKQEFATEYAQISRRLAKIYLMADTALSPQQHCRMYNRPFLRSEEALPVYLVAPVFVHKILV